MFRRQLNSIAAGVAALAIAAHAQATFHFMQIEQVIGGVNGDTSAQAIQLRMRAGGQNIVSASRLRVWDAAGQNPILLIDITTNVPNGAGGSRVLITSAGFAQYMSPSITPNFTMTNTIPASYLAAGSLTFEDDFGEVVWRLSWGGAAYTGSHAGSLDNDANGNYGPAFGGPLPSTSLQALRFQGAASAGSTSNAADYALTAGAATFTNNANASTTVTAPTPPCDEDISGDGSVGVADLLAVIGSWGPCPAPPAQCPADITNDNTVGVADLLAIISAWGACP